MCGETSKKHRNYLNRQVLSHWSSEVQCASESSILLLEAKEELKQRCFYNSIIIQSVQILMCFFIWTGLYLTVLEIRPTVAQRVIPPPQKQNKTQTVQTEEAVTTSQNLNYTAMLPVIHSKDFLEGGDSPLSSLSKSLVYTPEKGKLDLRYWVTNIATTQR